MSEHDQQSAVVEWFKLEYRQYEKMIWSNMNGAILCDLTPAKRKARMGHLIKEGFKKGVSDLLIAVPTRRYHGLFLEMKDQDKTEKDLSDAQQKHIRDVKAFGYAGTWAAGFDHAQGIIRQYMRGFEV